MFLTLDKFRQRVRELGEKRYFGHSCIAPFISMEGNLPPDESYKGLPEKVEGPEFGLHDFFVGRDRYLWLERTVKLPEAKEGCETVGLFDFGETGGGYNSGFESLLYVDGHPYQGVDTHHKEVIFRGKEGKEVCLTFLLWTGLEGGGEHTSFYHQCRQADVAYLHKKTDELYYFAKAITETLLLLPPENERYAKLKAALDRTFSCINWDEESFYETAEKAHDMLMDELDRMEKSTEVTVNVVGHTHIDVAWLWRLKHTREKAQRSFSTVLRLMELYDEYIFLQTQPQLYKYVKEDCPELYEKIRQKAAEGKWEPDGGMWVEADCNLSSGEALVRQFLYGTRFLEQEFGKKCEYLWLPDVFGYSWALPQILKQCEIKELFYHTMSRDVKFIKDQAYKDNFQGGEYRSWGKRGYYCFHQFPVIEIQWASWDNKLIAAEKGKVIRKNPYAYGEKKHNPGVSMKDISYLVNTSKYIKNSRLAMFRISKYSSMKGVSYLSGNFVPVDEYHCHHIKPLSKGGTNDFENLCVLSEMEHTILHSSTPERLYSIFPRKIRRIKALIDSLQRD